MAISITVTELARSLSECINRVAYQGEQFMLVRGNKTVAELRPVPQGVRLGDLPALLEGLPRLAVEEADAFAEDLAEIQKESSDEEGLRDPWAI